MARRGRGTVFRLLLLSAVLALAAPAVVAMVSAPALAQQDQQPRKRGGILDFLFGRRERPDPRIEQRRAPAPARRAPAGAATTTPAPTPEPQVEKVENARAVLVVGDFMAGGLGEGLEDAFAQAPAIKIVSRVNGSSGFVRDDFYNWPAEIAGILEEVKPAAVVVMIGSNDRQQLTVNGNREEVRSDAWTREYTARVKALAAEIRRANVPLLWVGMPSFKLTSMSADMLAFNDIYRAAAEEVGGEFIDIWDGFVDENGAFTQVGPDMNGQRVRLRGSDGINLTAAGKRKIAFYVERPLEKLLGNATAPGMASVGPEGEVPGTAAQQPAEIERTQPISLNDPALDGSGSLFGAPTPASEEIRLAEPVRKLVQDGIPPPGRSGRADDFSMPAAETSRDAEVSPPQPADRRETTATIPVR